MALLSAVLVFVMINDSALGKDKVSELSRIDGIILLSFFIIFISYTFSLMRSGTSEENLSIKDYSSLKSVALVIIGLVLLISGGRIIVIFAVAVVKSMGISERVIALSIMSIGTSLPELDTSISAVLKNNVDMAIGNVIGSNIFNVF